MTRSKLFVGVLALVLSAAHAHAFVPVGDPREIIPTEKSVIPYWETVIVEKGDTIAAGCEPFLVNVTSVTALGCWRLVAGVNKLTSFTINVGDRLLLPSAANTEAEVAARLAEYAAKAEADAKDNAELQALADNPLGMASEIRRALVGYDQIAKKLAVLETETLDIAQTEEIVTKVLSFVDVVDKTALTASVEQALTAARARGDLTAFQVSDIITAQLALAGLSETALQRAIVDAQAVRLDTLEATQKALATTVSAHSGAIEKLVETDGVLASRLDEVAATQVTQAETQKAQAETLKAQADTLAGLANADGVLASRLDTTEARVVTLEQGGPLVSLPFIVMVMVSLLTLVGVGITLRWLWRKVTNVERAVESRITEVKQSAEQNRERIAVVETNVSSKKDILIAPGLEDVLRSLEADVTYEDQVSVGNDTYVVTFSLAAHSEQGSVKVTMRGVKDQTQPVHIERVRSVLLKAGAAGRFLVPKPAAAAKIAA